MEVLSGTSTQVKHSLQTGRVYTGRLTALVGYFFKFGIQNQQLFSQHSSPLQKKLGEALSMELVWNLAATGTLHLRTRIRSGCSHTGSLCLVVSW